MQMYNEAKEKIRTSDIVIGFLKEKHEDIEDHFAKLIKLYNIMRSQRNKSITLIQVLYRLIKMYKFYVLEHYPIQCIVMMDLMEIHECQKKLIWLLCSG